MSACRLPWRFGKKRPVVGFDINTHRIDELKRGQDHTLEVDEAELAGRHAAGIHRRLRADLAQDPTYISSPSPRRSTPTSSRT